MSNTAIKIGVGVLFLLFLAQPSMAQDEIVDDTDLCVGSVNYSLQYLQTTDAKELHEGAWSILSSKETDDMQRLVALVIFHTIQEVSWRMSDMDTLKTPQDLEDYVAKIKVKSIEECEYAMNRFRFPDAEIR